MSSAPKPRGKAMYVASQSDKDWLLNVQRKLYARSRHEPGYVFGKLWGLVTDPRNLRMSLARVARNKGRRTAGVDGVTVATVISQGADAFLDQIRVQLRTGAFGPCPVRRVLIPKAGQPGKFRPLGIPTVTDRVVQAAVKHILEPVFEAQFFPASHGFRPGKSVHGALASLKLALTPRPSGPRRDERTLTYPWAIEGDIKACFDNIDHHGLMVRVRRRIGDAKVTRLVLAFLKAGVLSEDQFSRTDEGTPQGGILSPLLANIALGVIEERYERHVWPSQKTTVPVSPEVVQKRAAENRQNDGRRGLPVFYPLRYADDFIILVNWGKGPEKYERSKNLALEEKAALGKMLRDKLNLELSETKTLVTPVTGTLRFLGHHVRVRHHPGLRRMASVVLVPRDRSQRVRAKIKALFGGNTTYHTLENRLRLVNGIVRGWCSFYRHAWRAKKVFASLDYYVWWTIFRWLCKKHGGVPRTKLVKMYGERRFNRRGWTWRDGDTCLFYAATVRVEPFRHAWLPRVDFASNVYGEPGA